MFVRSSVQPWKPGTGWAGAARMQWTVATEIVLSLKWGKPLHRLHALICQLNQSHEHSVDHVLVLAGNVVPFCRIRRQVIQHGSFLEFGVTRRGLRRAVHRTCRCGTINPLDGIAPRQKFVVPLSKASLGRAGLGRGAQRVHIVQQFCAW